MISSSYVEYVHDKMHFCACFEDAHSPGFLFALMITHLREHFPTLLPYISLHVQTRAKVWGRYSVMQVIHTFRSTFILIIQCESVSSDS